MMERWLAIDWEALWQRLWTGPWQGTATVGGALLAIACWAGMAERRRAKRQNLDRVGCMPWTMIYVLCFFLGCVLVGGALHTALSG
ncbi:MULTISPECIES: hypothetical protein [unclassified Novosphingobium]|uniref:hypothetical protein n=1 Tax=unclassified Novosphingobium TaxID=2644732 RepID=UPI00146A16D9|nr:MULTISPECIES: hypothetical protein [unclassified Novosphingobium]NMN04260.1 ABC-type transport system involved in cytochrome c biogenesis permease subunit [Novosphingobium sp. SG919]NMN85749.1 ABC-type transport system involved in cytochrome c biogenesis permease subunit [Novosphingobium sp. SG916]